MKIIKISLSVLFSTLLSLSFAQFTVDTNSVASQLAQKLAGANVQITNAVLNCPDGFSGEFSYNNTGLPSDLGIDGGILLSSGLVNSISGPSNGPIISGSDNNISDPDLDTLLISLGETYTTDDVCALEFDIEVTGDTLTFNYVMGSEEYPDFVCGTVNDIFGFFISGPNPSGGLYDKINVALIPGTNIPVSINTVNNGSANTTAVTCYDATYSNFMNPNPAPNISVVNGVAFNQNTAVLEAIVYTIPCETYHFKLAIGDGGNPDNVFDSGVFLEEGSFSSNGTLLISTTISEDSFKLYENCVDGFITFRVDSVLPDTQILNFYITGTAINGLDYNFIPDSIIFLPNDTFATVSIDVIADGITEGLETIVVYEYTPCGTLGDSVMFTIEDSVIHKISTADSVLCSPGTVVLTGEGGIDYTWSPTSLVSNTSGATTVATINTTTTFYDTAFFGNCTFNDSLTIYLSQSQAIFDFQEISCGGANDGEYWVSWNDSAQGPFTYNFVLAGVTDSFNTNISPGFQFVTASDGYGCTFSNNHVFTDPAGMSYSQYTSAISCAGSNDGKACIYNLSDGTYTLLVDTNGVQYDSINFTINSDTFCLGSFAPGSYDLSFTNDTTGCSASFSANFVNPSGMSYSYDTTNVSCSGGNDGSICIYNTANGNYTANLIHNGNALAPINFTINSDTFCINNLSFGLYQVSLSIGCNNSNFTVNIEDGDTLIAGINILGTSLCAGGNIGSLNATATGGTAPYTYLWDNGSTANNIGSVPFGTHQLFVTDTLGCIDTVEVTVNVPPSMYLSASSDSVNCFGGNDGSATLDSISGGNPGYTYSWNSIPIQTTPTATNLVAGTYILTATDLNNCTISDTVEVLEPLDSVSIVLSTNVISCFGGDTCIEATITGAQAPYTYVWTKNNITVGTTEDICNLIAGTYTLTATDVQGCSATKTITITQVNEIVLSVDSTDVSCKGGNNGTATVSAIGGSNSYTFLWNDALAQTTALASNLVAGNYSVTVSDANDLTCTKTINVTVNEPTDSLKLTLDTIMDVLCFGDATGSINLTTSGGTTPYTYTWTGGFTNEDISNVMAGAYTLNATDNNGCAANLSGIIAEPVAALSVTYNQTNVSCFGLNDGAIDISPVGGTAPYTFAWSNLETTEDLNSILSGTYSVTIKDANNCQVSETITISQPNTVLITFNYSDYNGSNVSCNGASDGTIETIVQSGGTQPFTYSWDNSMSGNPITGIAANTPIVVTVSDGNGCNYNQAITPLSEPVALSVVKDSTDIICSGQNNGTATAIPLGGTAPYSFLWSDPSSQTSAMATSLAPNTYSCNVTDANGCTELIQVTVSEPNALIVTAETDSITCWGESDGKIRVLTTGGNGSAVEYSIDGGLTFQISNEFSELSTGLYNEIVVREGASNDCVSDPISVAVNQPDPMFIYINPDDTTIQINESVLLNIEVDPATGYYAGDSYSSADITNISWLPITGLNCSDCLNPTVLTYTHENEYNVTVNYSSFGCIATATAYIHVENNLKYFLPSGFSPQGDGINDKYFVYGDAIKTFHLAIFNRWGEKVFETSQQSEGWDGNYKGEKANTGVYTYEFEAILLDDKEIIRKGSISLIR